MTAPQGQTVAPRRADLRDPRGAPPSPLYNGAELQGGTTGAATPYPPKTVLIASDRLLKGAR
jgi:hypothetical protein